MTGRIKQPSPQAPASLSYEAFCDRYKFSGSDGTLTVLAKDHNAYDYKGRAYLPTRHFLDFLRNNGWLHKRDEWQHYRKCLLTPLLENSENGLRQSLEEKSSFSLEKLVALIFQHFPSLQRQDAPCAVRQRLPHPTNGDIERFLAAAYYYSPDARYAASALVSFMKYWIDKTLQETVANASF